MKALKFRFMLLPLSCWFFGLKTPYDDSTTHVVLSPLEFIGRLAALVPRPRANLTRFHGVFSLNSMFREQVVPQPVEHKEPQKSKVHSMTWTQRLRRVFAIEIEQCDKCGGPKRVIADFVAAGLPVKLAL